jgi:hypothetical protein
MRIDIRPPDIAVISPMNVAERSAGEDDVTHCSSVATGPAGVVAPD